MKSVVTLIIATVFSVVAFAQDVKVELSKTEWKRSEPFHFVIKASPEHLLEIAVFSEDKVVMHQSSRLSKEEELIELNMKDYPADNYHILVLGDDIHIQKDFVLKD